MASANERLLAAGRFLSLDIVFKVAWFVAVLKFFAARNN
jgi:hypothetical protein